MDIRKEPCETLRINRPDWSVLCRDLLTFDPAEYPEIHGIDLLAAGLPRVQAAAAANRPRGSNRELELLRTAVMLVGSIQPRAVVIDNVPDLAKANAYEPVRRQTEAELEELGYQCRWFELNAVNFEVPQDRRHGFLVAFRYGLLNNFELPSVSCQSPPTAGEALLASMTSGGWHGAEEWARQADKVAPTLVGGSWERGGADLGPTGSKKAWARMGVDGGTVADTVPEPDFRWNPSVGRAGMMPLTTAQVARLQGFPSDWHVAGRKTARYRQIANATPPPLACAVGESIAIALASACGTQTRHRPNRG